MTMIAKGYLLRPDQGRDEKNHVHQRGRVVTIGWRCFFGTAPLMPNAIPLFAGTKILTHNCIGL